MEIVNNYGPYALVLDTDSGINRYYVASTKDGLTKTEVSPVWLSRPDNKEVMTTIHLSSVKDNQVFDNPDPLIILPRKPIAINGYILYYADGKEHVATYDDINAVNLMSVKKQYLQNLND